MEHQSVSLKRHDFNPRACSLEGMARRRRWVAAFDDVGVTVPTAVGAEQYGSMVSIVRTI